MLLGQTALRLDFPAEMLGLELLRGIALRAPVWGVLGALRPREVDRPRPQGWGALRQVRHVPQHGEDSDGARGHVAQAVDRRPGPELTSISRGYDCQYGSVFVRHLRGHPDSRLASLPEE
eukprot:1630092-Pyramimonas_sp.AAC.1